MYKMQNMNKYLKNPLTISLIGTIIYYLLERFDCYINARKTSSLNRRSVYVFLLLVSATYIVSQHEELATTPEILTDIGNF